MRFDLRLLNTFSPKGEVTCASLEIEYWKFQTQPRGPAGRLILMVGGAYLIKPRKVNEQYVACIPNKPGALFGAF